MFPQAGIEPIDHRINSNIVPIHHIELIFVIKSIINQKYLGLINNIYIKLRNDKKYCDLVSTKNIVGHPN